MFRERDVVGGRGREEKSSTNRGWGCGARLPSSRAQASHVDWLLRLTFWGAILALRPERPTSQSVSQPASQPAMPVGIAKKLASAGAIALPACYTYVCSSSTCYVYTYS